MPKTTLSVWVIGASSGIGRAVAEAFAAAGHQVFATARTFVDPAQALPGITCLPIDVTDEQSIQTCLPAILASARRIDLLVYCAATIIQGPAELLSDEEWRLVQETVFLGAVRCVRAILPHMRAEHHGTIVLLSSLNGLLATPFTAAYVAAKHALEGYGAALAMELAPQGLPVMLVRPGDHQGGGSKCRRLTTRSTDSTPYQAAFAAATARIAADEAHGMDPARLAQGLVRRATRRRPPTVWTVARPEQRLMVWLHNLLPARCSNAILRYYYTRVKRPV